MSTAHQTNNIHPNSLDAFNELDIPPREQAVLAIYKESGKGLTDRDVLRKFTRGRSQDMNLVRPRITRLVNDPSSPLREIGKSIDRKTGQRVRVIQYEFPE